MSFNYSGSGQALVVREKCNANKPFTSSSVLTNTSDIYSRIINYENSIIGKRLLSGQLVTSYPLNLIASDNLLNFRIIPYTTDSGSFEIIYITGVFKKCNYSSREIQKFIIPENASKEVKSYFESNAQCEDELKKVLDSDPVLRASYEKLIAK